MTLVRVWRRQLWAASGAALIVPSAVLAALAVLALGGSFSGLGVLGQIFSGPPAPSAGPLSLGRAGTLSGGASVPVVPAAHFVLASRPTPHAMGGGGAARLSAPVSRPGASPVTSSKPVTGSPRPPARSPASPSPASSGPSPGAQSSNPNPSPSPRPTLVDQAVQAVTTVTSQVPGPVGSTVTQVAQGVGSTVDKLLP